MWDGEGVGGRGDDEDEENGNSAAGGCGEGGERKDVRRDDVQACQLVSKVISFESLCHAEHGIVLELRVN